MKRSMYKKLVKYDNVLITLLYLSYYYYYFSIIILYRYPFIWVFLYIFGRPFTAVILLLKFKTIFLWYNFYFNTVDNIAFFFNISLYLLFNNICLYSNVIYIYIYIYKYYMNIYIYIYIHIIYIYIHQIYDVYLY